MAAQGRAQGRGQGMLAYRELLKENRDAAFALLEKKQRKQAEKFESALKKEMESAEPEESGMGGRRGRGPGI